MTVEDRLRQRLHNAPSWVKQMYCDLDIQSQQMLQNPPYYLGLAKCQIETWMHQTNPQGLTSKQVAVINAALAILAEWVTDAMEHVA